MKKSLLFFAIIAFLCSCGPHRMKCGPGRRCLVDAPKEKILVKKPIV